ncbi:hypothetical protein BRADI_1g77275v3 [Brachypodium distachyon]|uniref:Uncharacterized protein n=1 Tax=Brachypodium distachyon TaxID=15368 RepID=A0A2K2DVL3_BRADI|nr:hypothetical protein BRADI_1g77275v3 [Brachypodium distachyon]
MANISCLFQHHCSAAVRSSTNIHTSSLDVLMNLFFLRCLEEP